MPSIFVIAGPNGAGKSTAAPTLLRDEFKVPIYVNADTIATGLSAFDPESAAFQAGRIMLTQLDQLRQSGKSFAFETTLATRGYARWLQQTQISGYQVYLLFLALPSPEIAVQRVALRVRSGGHGIPEDTIRRRYQRGLSNFFQLYRPLCDEWIFADNADEFPKILAEGGRNLPTLTNNKLYLEFEEQYGIPKV
ncbi:MAG: zeta toxin family protein [Candidatus Eremiobacteraeota bacterium]|nr:zeta toxin family protein [Candidatus Eremiobacteraeota bacterium]